MLTSILLSRYPLPAFCRTSISPWGLVLIDLALNIQIKSLYFHFQLSFFPPCKLVRRGLTPRFAFFICWRLHILKIFIRSGYFVISTSFLKPRSCPHKGVTQQAHCSLFQWILPSLLVTTLSLVLFFLNIFRY